MAYLAARVSLITFGLLLGRHVRAQNCYYPDQTIETSHIICNGSAEASLCCPYGATCLTNGLCFHKWDTSFNTGTCTDKTWTDPSCFQSCLQSPGIDHGFNTLYRCNNNRWCCSTSGNETSCCSDYGVSWFFLKFGDVMGGTGFKTGFTIAPSETSQPAVALSQSTAATRQDEASSPLSQSQSTASAGKNVDTGIASASDTTKIALGAGLGVGLPLLAGLIIALLFLRRLTSRSKGERTHSGKDTNGLVAHGNRMVSHELVEMENPSSEMPNSRREITQELGA